MAFRIGKFYEFDGLLDGYKYEGKYVCSEEYPHSFGFRPLGKDFIRYGHGGFVLRKNDKAPSHKEIFREMKADQKKEMFKFALKIASCGDIDGQLCGSDSGQIKHYEYEYQLFSKFWKVDIGKEKEWLENFENDTYSVMNIPQDIWFEDEEIVGNALCKMRMVKQYLAEMKTSDKKSTTG